jgi:hypothetical protein
MATITAAQYGTFTSEMSNAPAGLLDDLSIDIADLEADDGDPGLWGPTSDALEEAAAGAGLSNYIASATVTLPGGTYSLRWFWQQDPAPAAPVLMGSDTLVVTASELGGLTLAELKRRLDRENDVDDDFLVDYLAAAFEQAQKPHPYGCGRLLVSDPLLDSDDPVQRVIPTRSRRVFIRDAREITEVLLDDVAIADTAYTTTAKDGLIVGLRFADDGTWAPRRERVVKITGRFGFQTLPVSLADAIYTLAARDYYERAAQYADQVEILEGTAVQAYYRQLPPRTKLAFASYAIPLAAVGLS